MNKKRKVISILLALVMLLGLGSYSAFADNEMVLKAGDVEAVAGTDVVLPLSWENNPSDVGAMNAMLTGLPEGVSIKAFVTRFDDYNDENSTDYSTILYPRALFSRGSPLIETNIDNGRVIYVNAAGQTGDGTFIYALLSISEEAINGEYTLNIEQVPDTSALIGTKEGVFIDYTTESGTLTITGGVDPDDPDPVDLNPTLVTTLEDNYTTKQEKITFDVWAHTESGTKIAPGTSGLSVTLNNEAVDVNWNDSEKTSYTLNLVLGDNTVVVTAKDGEYTTTLTYTITLEEAAEGEVIGQFVFSMQAHTIGLGYIIEPTYEDIVKGENSAQTLIRILAKYGYTLSYTGTPESSFYLSALKPAGSEIYTTEPEVPETLLAKLTENYYNVDYSYNSTSLGEFDFTWGSGWMYCLNNVFPNVGFADKYPLTGDVMRVQFTLAYGSDISGDGGFYGAGFFSHVDRDALTTKVAQINSYYPQLLAIPEYKELYDEAVDVLNSFGLEQDAFDAALAALNGYEYEGSIVDQIIEMIDNIGEVTLEKRSMIEGIEEAFNNLSGEQQAEVTNADVLIAALTELSGLTVFYDEAQPVVQAITNLGTITLAKEEQVIAARTAYDALTDGAKAYVTNYSTLTTAEARIIELQALQDQADPVIAKILALIPLTPESAATVDAVRAEYNALPSAARTMVNSAVGGSNVITYLAGAAPVVIQISEIGEVTLDSEAAITAARTAYNALASTRKNYVSNLDVLEAAETRLAELKDTDYIVSLIGTQSVSVGSDAIVNVAVSSAKKEAFNAIDITLSYDSEVLTYKGIYPAADYTVKDDGIGTLRIVGFGGAKEMGSAFTITFKTLGLTGSDDTIVSISSAKVGETAGAVGNDAADAVIDAEKGSVAISVTGYSVTLGEYLSGAAIATPDTDYTFSAEDWNNYDYTISVTVGGEDITSSVVNNGDGTYTIPGANVTGSIVVTVDSRTAKSYSVTFDGSGAADATGAATAAYNTDYSFTLTEVEGYSYEVTIMVGGEVYTGYGVDNGAYTIPGTDITGSIVVSISKTLIAPESVSVTFEGTGAGDATGDATAAYKEAYTFSVTKANGYEYDVSATVGGEEITVTDNGDGTYTIAAADVTDNIVITIDKTMQLDVTVNEYVKLDNASMFLVLASGEVSAGSTYAYDGNAMYWSEKYEAYAYLVIAEEAFDAEAAAAKIAIVEGEVVSVTYDGDVNETGLVDINDAQLVYDAYNAKYNSFDDMSMKKFLKGDLNGDYVLTVQDAAAVVAILLG